VFASIVLITMPIDSVSWSRNASCVGLKRSNDASSSTPFTWPSKMIGSTRMFCGGALPRPDAMAMYSRGTLDSRIFCFSMAHCPTRPSPRSSLMPSAPTPRDP
jgi:hypothetical protein